MRRGRLRSAESAARTSLAMLLVAASALACALSLAAPEPAHAATWVEGTGTSHQFHLTPWGVRVSQIHGDQYLDLPYLAVEAQPTGTKPQMVEALADGAALFTDPTNGFVYELSSTGTRTWLFNSTDDPTLELPVCATRRANGNTIIVDRKAARVFEVTRAKAVVGSYSDGLSDPRWAAPARDNTLIVDAQNAYRVIIVDAAGTIVWSYGEQGVSGTTNGRLAMPASAQYIAATDPDNDTILIADAGGDRVIEVNRKSKAIVRTFGTGTGAAKLSSPSQAKRLDNGDWLIADTGNNRVIEVNSKGTIVQTFGKGAGIPAAGIFQGPLSADRSANGFTFIADKDPIGATVRLVKYAYATSGYADSDRLDFGASGVRKRFLTITWKGTVPKGASIALSYSVDGATYKAVPAKGTLPSTAVGTYIQYKATLKRGSEATGPRLDSVTLTWQQAPTSTGTGGNITYPAAGTNTGTATNGDNTGGAGTVNPSYTGTPTAGVVATDAVASDGGILRGMVMAPAASGNSGGGRAGVGSGAPLASQLGGLALLSLVFSTGFGYGPLARLVPSLVHLIGVSIK